MKAFEQISQRIEDYRDEMIDMQLKLGSIPAISPLNGGEGETKKAEVLLSFLKEMGFKNIQLIKAPDLNVPSGYRPNIIAYFQGENPEKTIWVMTHMDVVPAGEISLWDGDPFKPWIKEGKIFGRGAEDNQQAMIASLYAIKALKTDGIKPKHNLGVALFADEETGSKKGIEYVLNNTNFFEKKDFIIVPDTGEKEGTLIEVAEKSLLWIKFKTTGKQAHGSTPDKGVNSLKAASYLITELNSLYHHFNFKDSLFDPPFSTFEPTKKEENVPNINTIPGEDVFYMDCRILPHYSIEEVKEEIKKIVSRSEDKFKVNISLEEIQESPAAPPTPSNAPVVIALKKAIKEVYKKNGKPTGIGGRTVAAIFRRANFYAACWSKTDDTAHQPNEYCIIDNMIGDSKVFAHIFTQE